MQEKDTKNQNKMKRTVRISTLSRIFAVIGLLLLLFEAYNLHMVVGNYKSLVREFGFHMDSHGYISQLQNGSDDMTEQSRLFVVTKNPECMEKYFRIVDEKVREQARENLVQIYTDKGYDKSLDNLKTALDESNALMDAEIHSMKLMVEALSFQSSLIPKDVKDYTLSKEEEKLSPAEKEKLAKELVFGETYRQNKEQIDSSIQRAVTAMSDQLENDTQSGIDRMWTVIYKLVISCVLLAILFVVVFFAIAVLIIKPLRTYIRCVKDNRLFEILGSYEFQYLALTYNNIFEINQENRARMNFKLEHDTLTNAFSRLAFDEHKQLLSDSSTPLALLIIDVDQFKEVNDLFGHEKGDQALVCIVDTLHQQLRGDDIIARIGGDEFAVLILNVYEHAKDVIGHKLDRINLILQHPENNEPKLSLSIGIAFSEKGYSDELFMKADRALYEAKEKGRCGYVIAE